MQQKENIHNISSEPKISANAPQGTTYERYSDDQIRQAREADIMDFLERTEGFSFKKQGNSYQCIEHDSLVINADRKRWFWNSQKTGGNNALDWCGKIKNMTFADSMKLIVGNGDVVIKTAPKVAPPPQKESIFSLPRAAADNRRVYAYLTKTRGISPNIVNQMLKENKLYQDERGNCVFVGHDSENKARYAGIRGTLSDVTYRGEVSGSDKRYSFRMESQSKKPQTQAKLFVFESPIEAMSHATIINREMENDLCHTVHNRLSLGGTSEVALVEYLKNNPNTQEIHFCLNNDEAGRTATNALMDKFSAQGFTVLDESPKQYGDFNEHLVAMRAVENAETTENAVSCSR
jgi:hypothetical protein